MANAEPRFRRAVRGDLPDIVRMLADDVLGAQREECASPLPPGYHSAFDAIDADPNHELIVGELGARVVAVLQLTCIPTLSRRGSRRAVLEGVRVDSAMRSSGIGRQLVAWAIERARGKGCRLVQLTSDKRRRDAIRFYESLGFVASHEGMKLELPG